MSQATDPSPERLERPESARSLSIVVPVYNGQQSLPELVAGLEETFRPLPIELELVLVDDGSPDGSWQVIEKLAAEHAWVRGLRLMRNFGQHNALLAGIRAARHDVVVTMDDDLQHPPGQIPKLLEALKPDVDLVYGYAEEEEHDQLRSVASRSVKFALSITLRSDVAQHVSAFRAFRLELRDAFARNTDAGVTLDVLLSWATTRIRAIPVRMEPRRYGRSNYTFGSLTRHALNMITGYSILPLRLVTYMGIGFSLFGLAILAFVLIHDAVYGGSVPGFTFLASLITVFSGAQMLALGILGEYLGRIHFRSMNRPQYFIRDSTT